jgi:molybdate transport system substrate-binding protein
MLRRAFLICCCLGLLGACQSPPRLRVAVAANAQYVARALKQEFEKQTGVELELVVNSSGNITAQIEQGAPYDVFLSADTRYARTLFQKGLTLGEPRVYGYGKLILWTTQPLDLSQSLASLLATGQGKIAVANPKSAPYGAAALQALAYYGLQQAVQERLVLGESVAQVNQYILAGTVELGFTAQSVVLEPSLQGKGQWREVDPRAYAPIAQSAVLLRTSAARQAKAARQFYEFLYSRQGQSIFRRYGYSPAAPAL